MDIKTIICPTDFSEPSERALKMARSLALRFGARVILVHAIEPVPPLPSPQVGTAVAAFDVPGYQDVRREQAQHHLDEIARRYDSSDLALETRLEEGTPATVILELARQENADVIVTATHGRSGFRRFLFGSVAEKIIRSAHCPVMTVTQPED